MEQKRILVIGAGELQTPLIQTAKARGLFVIAADRNPEAPGFALADLKLIADTFDPEEIIRQLDSAPNGVLTAGTDAALTVAAIARHYKLPGHSFEAAQACTHKPLLRKTLQEAGVPVPVFYAVTQLADAAEAFQALGGKAVVKPASSMGARGVSLACSPQELEQAFALAREYASGEILVEEYLEGPEISVDSLVHGGTVTITGVADRIIEYAPYFVETGHILPSSLDQEKITQALEVFRDSIKALGLSHGAAKGDIKITARGAVILETAARLSGGFMSSHTFPLATGINLNEAALKLALGEPLPELSPSKNAVSVERAIMCPPGKIVSIHVPPNLKAAHISVRRQAGDIMPSPKNNLDKIGNVICVAPTRREALKAANEAVLKIKVSVQSDIPLPQLVKAAEDRARELLRPGCTVCPECNGVSCRGKVPGVGGVGTGEGFIQTYQRLRDFKLLPRYIHNVRQADASVEMFGVSCSLPVFTAPIAGAKINYNGALSEWALQNGMIKGALQAGTVGFTPDPVTYDIFGIIEDITLQNYGHTITICKPRLDLEMVHKRIQRVLDAGALGIGTDVDGMGLRTINAVEGCGAKNIDELRSLSKFSPKLFVVKGILSTADAEAALAAGATHIIVSNHGGRINEAFAPAIDMLPSIKSFVGSKAVVLVDGAIRTAADVAKCLILGADGVLIGRPSAYLSVGGGSEAVRAHLLNLKSGLEGLMLMLGISKISEFKNRTDLLKDMKNLI